MHTSPSNYDCIVIGAGPAGLTSATLLAQYGRKVLVLEKETFPRFRVGESMIPYNYFPLERIGMIDKLRASSFPHKYSVQFVRQDGTQSQPFYFDQHMNHPAAQTWQVTRSVFDNMLMENAREKGVEVIERMNVRELIEEDGCVVGVLAEDDRGRARSFRGAITIDGSGRVRLAMTRLGWRELDRSIYKIAVWGYFRGAMRDPGKDAGATTITYVEGKNWFWYIPMQDDIVSVGIVGARDYLMGRTNDLETIFNDGVRKNVWIHEHLKSGSINEQDYMVNAHLSYRSRYCAKDGLILVGDALSFLDPVFSTGLFLALSSGELAGDAVEEALKAGDVTAKRFTDYGEIMCRRIEILRQLVHAFYAEKFSFKDIVMKYPDLQGKITDVLIGNVDQDFSELSAAMSEFLTLPSPISHGRAMV